MSERAAPQKSPEAFRTISEVADELKLPQHVLRFWETRFPEVKPIKRAGGRRFYRPEDVDLLRAVKTLLYRDGYTIKGVQRLLREQGAEAAGFAPDAAPDDLTDDLPDDPPVVGPAARGDGLPDLPAPCVVPGEGRVAPAGASVAERLRAVLRDLDDCAAAIARARSS